MIIMCLEMKHGRKWSLTHHAPGGEHILSHLVVLHKAREARKVSIQKKEEGLQAGLC